MSDLTEAEVYDSLDKVKRYIDIMAEENSGMKHRIQRQEFTIQDLEEQVFYYQSNLEIKASNNIPWIGSDQDEEWPEPHPLRSLYLPDTLTNYELREEEFTRRARQLDRQKKEKRDGEKRDGEEGDAEKWKRFEEELLQLSQQ